MLLKRFLKDEEGGANLDYAIFVAIFTLLLSSGLYAVSTQIPEQVTAWNDDRVEIDGTLTGSITDREGSFTHRENDKTYRVYQLPAGLQKKQ